MGALGRIALLFVVLLAGGCPDDHPHCKKNKRRCGDRCIGQDMPCDEFPVSAVPGDGTAGNGF